MRILVDIEHCLRHGAKQMISCRIASCWTVIIFAHFITRVCLLGVTFGDNNYARSLTSLRLDAADASSELPAIQNNMFQICDGVPGHGRATCQITSTNSPFEHQPRSCGFRPISFRHNVTISVDGGEKVVGGKCIAAMQHFHDVFRDALAEDVATMSFQLWVLAISIHSIIYNSIPHLAISAASHLLDTGWTGYNIWNTLALREEYERYVVHSACNGVDILGKWWDVRLSHAIPSFAVNVVILISILVASVSLYKRFVGAAFGSAGASLIVNRPYKLVSMFSAFLQLSTSFTAISIGLWIDRIYNDTFRELSVRAVLYRAIFVVVAIAIIPWNLTGQFSISRELPRIFIVFAVLHVFMLALWPSMFSTSMYACAFKTWPFFACVSVTSCAFLVATTLVAIACRLNFGKRLSHFLAAQGALSSADFVPMYFPGDDASDTRAAIGCEIVYPKRVYSIESRGEYLPELKYDSYTGSYTRRPIARSQRRGGFWRRLEGISPLHCIGSRKDQARGTRYTDYGSDATRVSQLGEPQFKLPMRALPQPFSGRRENTTSSISMESTAITQGVTGGIGMRQKGSEAFRKGGVRNLVSTPTGARFDQRTPLTTYVIPHDWKTKGIGGAPKRGFGA